MRSTIAWNTTKCNDDCGRFPNRECQGHAITITRLSSIDQVQVKIERVDGLAGPEVYLFDDKVFAEIVRMWSAEE